MDVNSPFLHSFYSLSPFMESLDKKVEAVKKGKVKVNTSKHLKEKNLLGKFFLSTNLF